MGAGRPAAEDHGGALLAPQPVARRPGRAQPGPKEVTDVKVSELMTRDVLACRPTDSIERAVQIMWEQDCGCVPVVDAQQNVVGMITDRDACMGAYTKGCALGEMSVAQAMSNGVALCRMHEDVEAALRMMADKQLHRLPVVDQGQRLAGVLSMADVLQAMAARDAAARRKYGEEILETLAAVTRPRRARQAEKPAKRIALAAGA
jgi:CBS-domain-containing membrane protein